MKPKKKFIIAPSILWIGIIYIFIMGMVIFNGFVFHPWWADLGLCVCFIMALISFKYWRTD